MPLVWAWPVPVLLAAAGDPTVTEVLTLINSGGVLGLMAFLLWLFLAGRVIPNGPDGQLAKAEARALKAECLLVESHQSLIKDVVPALTRANDLADRTNGLAERMLDVLARGAR